VPIAWPLYMSFERAIMPQNEAILMEMYHRRPVLLRRTQRRLMYDRVRKA
jgi:hypothetical protein